MSPYNTMVKPVRKYSVYICFAVCFIILLWRARMGFCWTDECFYVSTADRFYRGSIPLVDEWYRTQLSSLIMLPFSSNRTTPVSRNESGGFSQPA